MVLQVFLLNWLPKRLNVVFLLSSRFALSGWKISFYATIFVSNFFSCLIFLLIFHFFGFSFFFEYDNFNCKFISILDASRAFLFGWGSCFIIFLFCSREKCWFVHVEARRELRHKWSRWKLSPRLPSASGNCGKFHSRIALTGG